MFWFVLAHLVAFFVDLAIGRWRNDRDKDLQILVLRHQVLLLQRQRPLYWLLRSSASVCRRSWHDHAGS